MKRKVLKTVLFTGVVAVALFFICICPELKRIEEEWDGEEDFDDFLEDEEIAKEYDCCSFGKNKS